MGQPSTLSLVTATNSGPAVASAFLRAWRPFVDEIIVAVDERAAAGTPAACADLADRVEILPAAPYVERYLGWLHAQPSGDWVLRMDDDELPTDALTDALPELMASRRHSHFWLRSLWLASPDRYITSEPWVSDIHPRLARNTSGLLRCHGRLHQEMEIAGDYRFTDVPYLHVTTAVDALTDRRRRAERYERTGSPRLGRGASVNALYTPEDCGDLATAALSSSDAARVRTYMQAAAGTMRDRQGSDNHLSPTVSLQEVERWLHEIPTHAIHSARARLVHPVDPVTCGTIVHTLVEIENLGDGTWPAGPDGWPRIRVGHHWADGLEGARIDSQTRGYFTEPVQPGQTTTVNVPIVAPTDPGTYELQIDVLEEFVRWFDQPATQQVTVLPATAGSVGPPTTSRERRDVFADDLRALHDALAPTRFADRYWVWGGLLLGWAREGQLMDHDLHDADFAFVAGDPAFAEAARALVAAGFRPHLRFSTNDGEFTEWVFERNGGKFEFWAMTPFGGELEYHSYAHGGGDLGPPCQARCRVLAQHREPFAFLDRTWHKPVDHDLELTGLYGDWRTPDPGWWYMTSHAIVERELWYRTDCAWDGMLDETEAP